MENTNTLKLRKCAYIFDSSASRYFYGTKAQHAEKAATEKEMKKYFEDPEKLNEKIPYTKDSKGKDILTMLIYEIDKTDIKKYGTKKAIENGLYIQLNKKMLLTLETEHRKT